MNLAGRALAGVKWTGFTAILSFVLQFVSIIVLSRLLPPRDFGLMGMITVILGFARAFADMGLNNAIIHKQEFSRDRLSSLYWANAMVGFLFFLVLLLLSPAVVWYFREPALYFPYIISTFVFLLSVPGQQFQALLQKKLRFDLLARIQITASVMGYGVSIAMALMGYGVLSLVMGQVVLQGVQSAMYLWVYGRNWFPRWRFSFSDLKEYLGFGLFQMGERLLNYLSQNVDYLVIGRVMGAVPLGYYTLAYKVVHISVARINPVLTRVAFPAFSRIQDDDEALRRSYKRIAEFLSMAVFPFLAGVAVAGEPFILSCFGEKWLPSLLLIQIMALAGCMKTVSNPSGSIMLAKGRADVSFYWNLIQTVIRVVVIAYCGRLGLIQLAWGILFLQVFDSVLVQLIVNRLIRMGMGEFLESLLPALVSTAIMAVAVWQAEVHTGGGQNPRFQLFILILTGAVTYPGSILLFFRDRAIYYRGRVFGRIANKEK